MAGLDKNIAPEFNDESALTRPDAMTEAEYETAFRQMAKDYFDGVLPSEKPWLFYVTGLPGAGKSTYLENAVIDRPELGDYVHINFDDLRSYHPRYAEHVKNDPLNAAARIDTAVERLIGWLTEEAARQHVNVTLDDAAMGRDITRLVLAPFQSEGYDIQATVIATPAALARQSVHLRFEENFAAAKAGASVVPRWVNTTEQDNAPTALVETVETLEQDGIPRNITVVNRDAKTLFNGEPGGQSAVDAVRNETTRALNAREQADYQLIAERIAGYAERREKPAAAAPGKKPAKALISD